MTSLPPPHSTHPKFILLLPLINNIKFKLVHVLAVENGFTSLLNKDQEGNFILTILLYILLLA